MTKITAKDRIAAYQRSSNPQFFAAMGGKIPRKKYADGGIIEEEVDMTDPVPVVGPGTGVKEPKALITPEQIKVKYKSNPNLRYTWGDALTKKLPSGQTVKESVKEASQQTGIDPSLLYASAMEEGMSIRMRDPGGVSEAYGMAVGWDPDPKTGKKRAKQEFDPNQYPVDGFYNYGLDTFSDNFDRLVKKGYLPKEFKSEFTPLHALNEKDEKVNSAAFKSDKAALMAKAAMMKDVQDNLDSRLAKSGVKLTPKQKQFFLLAGYNAGEGNMNKMIQSYKDKGYLKDDKFLDANFKPASYAGVWNNVQRRLTNMDMLQQEGFLDWDASNQQPEAAMAKKQGKFQTGGVAGGGWNAAAQALPAVGSLIEALVNKPSVSSTQPIMNAQAIHNMSNPYDSPGLKFAYGGELEDVDDDQYFDWLEQMFDNTDMAEEDDEFINMEEDTIEYGMDNDETEPFDDEESETGVEPFATGGTAKKRSGIYIKPSKRGTFTAAAKKHGKSVQAFASQVLANKSNYSSAMVKKANFARNASKWKHAYGGWSGMVKAYATEGNAPIEVEGEEILELPNGQMQQMVGPTHEEGGIPMNVPEGTKIYSDRLKIEGKSMQQRKASRERQLAKLDKLLSKNPTDVLTKNTVNATRNQLAIEDAQDMELQNVANKIYNGEMGERAMGGMIGGKKYQTGGTTDDGYLSNLMGYGDIQIPYAPGQQPAGIPGLETIQGTATPPIAAPSTALEGTIPTLQTRNTTPASASDLEEEYRPAAGMTTGDYIGLGANVFGAIAPILNTRNAAAARQPNLNRYIGVGREAIEANDLAQSLVGRSKANALRDLDTSTGTAIARAREGARGINTMRAMNIATDIAKQKAAGQIEQTGNDQLINLLGQRGQLTNWRDQMQAAGATERDVREAQDIDNYYTNMAENLANFATQAGNIGRNLNISKGNKDNTAMLEAMSEYFDFGRDKKGKLVLRNKKGK